MFEEFVRDGCLQARLKDSVFAEALEVYEAHLVGRGHSARTIEAYGRVVGHFVGWLSRHQGNFTAMDDDTVREFIEKHLPRCHCALPGPLTLFTVRAALGHLTSLLRKRGQIQTSDGMALAPIDREVARYDAYLRDVCGLCEATRIYRRRYVREFLAAMYGSGRGGPTQFERIAVMRFLTRRARRVRPGSAQVIASSVRSYLRFQQLLGACGPDLLAAVPSVPDWPLARLPQVLSEEQVTRLLSAPDQRTEVGRRDYAILRCLVDLGLRADEVAHVQLDDIDWSAGTLHLSRTKGRHAGLIPLPDAVGRAIAVYLARGRPAPQDRAVFLRHRPPVGCAISAELVRKVARRAAAQAGLTGPLRCPHALRHTAASRMLRAGASLKEVADVLRHRTLDTTAIYAKVDLLRLGAVALPWPKRRS